MSTQIVPEVLEYSGSITASGQSLPFKVNSNAGIALHCAGTFAGVNCTFEVSFDSTTGTDGTWIPVLAARNNANTGESTSGVLAAAPAYYWEAYIAGARWFRIRSTAWTSGVQKWKVAMCAIAQDPNPQVNVVGSAAVNGTVTATPSLITTYALNSAAGSNLVAVKATAGSLYGARVFNAGAAIAYLKLYNKATAPVLATDVPVMVLPIAAGALAGLDLGSLGSRFGLGIAIATTGLAADTDATAVAAAQLKIQLDYI
jgi:hypothetical protein